MSEDIKFMYSFCYFIGPTDAMLDKYLSLTKKSVQHDQNTTIPADKVKETENSTTEILNSIYATAANILKTDANTEQHPQILPVDTVSPTTGSLEMEPGRNKTDIEEIGRTNRISSAQKRRYNLDSSTAVAKQPETKIQTKTPSNMVKSHNVTTNKSANQATKTVAMATNTEEVGNKVRIGGIAGKLGRAKVQKPITRATAGAENKAGSSLAVAKQPTGKVTSPRQPEIHAAKSVASKRDPQAATSNAGQTLESKETKADEGVIKKTLNNYSDKMPANKAPPTKQDTKSKDAADTVAKQQETKQAADHVKKPIIRRETVIIRKNEDKHKKTTQALDDTVARQPDKKQTTDDDIVARQPDKKQKTDNDTVAKQPDKKQTTDGVRKPIIRKETVVIKKAEDKPKLTRERTGNSLNDSTVGKGKSKHVRFSTEHTQKMQVNVFDRLTQNKPQPKSRKK